MDTLFVNKKTSHICHLNIECISDSDFTKIKEKYSVNSIKDTDFKNRLAFFNNSIFSNNVLYFKDSPSELIGVDSDYHSIRYVYNPNICDSVVDGLSIELEESEKKRLKKRIQKVYYEYEYEKGKKKLQEWK